MISLASDHPAAEALGNDRVVMAADPTPWTVGETQTDTLVAVPLSYADRQFGVLVIGSLDNTDLDHVELAFIEALGWMISTAIDAARSRRNLVTDDIVKLAFEIRDPAFLPLHLAHTGASTLEYEGTTYDGSGQAAIFLSVTGEATAVIDAAQMSDRIEAATVITPDETGGLIEYEFSAGNFIKELIERGATIQALTVEPAHARIVLEASRAADPRRIEEWMTGTYPDSELIGFRERERPPITKREFLSDLDAALTRRQRTAIELAYCGGFYERSREITGDDLADHMDISRSTFHNHLRAAERKVIGALLDASVTPARTEE